MNLKSYPKAFTLVELIITISIVSILATIAYVSINKYVAYSRDSNRIASLKNIENGLSVYFVQSSKYPTPDGNVYNGLIGSGIFLKKGVIGDTISKIIKTTSIPLDPKTQTNYLYSTKFDQSNFQVAGILESQNSLSYINSAYAESYVSNVNGDYPGTLKYNSGSQICISNVPSLIFTNNADSDLFNTGTYFLVNNFGNTPENLVYSSNEIIKSLVKNNTAELVNICANNNNELISTIKSNPIYLASFGGNENNITFLIDGKITFNQIVDNIAASESNNGLSSSDENISLNGPDSITCSGCQ